jgi:uncharacterized protein
MTHRKLGSLRFLLGLALLAGLVGTALLALPLSKLRIQVNDLELLPQSSPVLAADAAVRKTFGSDERLIISFESRAGQITDARFKSDFQFFISRLTRSHNIRMILFDRLYRPRFFRAPIAEQPYFLHPPDPQWIERALSATAITGQLAAGKSRRTAFLEATAFSNSGVRSIETRVREAAAALEQRRPGTYQVRSIGRHVVLNGLGEAIFQDLKQLLPWSFLLIGLLFWLLFRSWVLVGLSVFQSALTVVLTLAILARLGHSLSLMTALIPVLITVLGIADEIHFFGEFLRLKALHPEREAPSLAWETLRRQLFPCTAITLTTIIGFASFLATDAPALRVFGFLAGLGIGISWLISITLVPTVLALVPIRATPRWSQRRWSLESVTPFLSSRAVPIALSLVLIPGILKLRIDDGWTRNFQPDHPIVQDVRWFERESVGLYQFDLMLTRKDGRSWTDPAELAALAALQEEVDSSPDVTASLSPVDLVRDRAWELGDTAAPRPPLPATKRDVERILATYPIFNEAIFERMFLDRSGSAARLIFAAASDDYETATRVKQALERAVRHRFDSGVVVAAVGGSAERGRALIESIVTSQGASVGVSLLVSLLALGFASGRWGRSLHCIGANIWALLLVLGAAGWLGLEMGVASSSFLALGVGVGLDYGIHLAFDPESSGPGRGMVFLRVMANVLVVGAGLAVLMFSANPTIARLGLLIVLSLVASGYTAVVVLSPSRRQENAALSTSPAGHRHLDEPQRAG